MLQIYLRDGSVEELALEGGRDESNVGLNLSQTGTLKLSIVLPMTDMFPAKEQKGMNAEGDTDCWSSGIIWTGWLLILWISGVSENC